MIVHENVELLSSFVDDELEAPQREAVAAHLADCPPCRERIGGLRRVVEELRTLEVVAPPASLSGRVRQAVLFDDARGRGLRHSAESLRRWTDQPLLLPLFGVVTALAVFLYLFTAWAERADHPGTRLVVGAGDGATAVAPLDGAIVVLAERTFSRIDGRWVEHGADPVAVAETLDLRRPSSDHAALEAFRALGGTVVLRHDGRFVTVDYGPAAP